MQYLFHQRLPANALRAINVGDKLIIDSSIDFVPIKVIAGIIYNIKMHEHKEKCKHYML